MPPFLCCGRVQKLPTSLMKQLRYSDWPAHLHHPGNCHPSNDRTACCSSHGVNMAIKIMLMIILLYLCAMPLVCQARGGISERRKCYQILDTPICLLQRGGKQLRCHHNNMMMPCSRHGSFLRRRRQPHLTVHAHAHRPRNPSPHAEPHAYRLR